MDRAEQRANGIPQYLGNHRFKKEVMKMSIEEAPFHPLPTPTKDKALKDDGGCTDKTHVS